MGLTQNYSHDSAEYSRCGTDRDRQILIGDAAGDSPCGDRQQDDPNADEVECSNDEVGEDCRVVLLPESAETELERRVAWPHYVIAHMVPHSSKPWARIPRMGPASRKGAMLAQAISSEGGKKGGVVEIPLVKLRAECANQPVNPLINPNIAMMTHP